MIVSNSMPFSNPAPVFPESSDPDPVQNRLDLHSTLNAHQELRNGMTCEPVCRWMLEQERYLSNLDSDLDSPEERLHPLYQEVAAQDGTVLYFNKFAGYLGTIQSPRMNVYV